MVELLMAAQVLVLIGMLAASIWGWKNIEPDGRVRVRSGPTGIDWTISKNTTLIMTPAVGLFIVIATLTFRDAPDPGFAALGLAVMLIFLAAHWSAVRRAAL